MKNISNIYNDKLFKKTKNYKYTNIQEQITKKKR